MAVTSLTFHKSETRQLVESDLAGSSSRLGEPTDWHMSNGTFFTAFVVITALLAVVALIAR